MEAAQKVIHILEDLGVKVIFGLPGEELEKILYYIEKSSIRFITVRHEQAAGFAAGVYGRITGLPGVCVATLGPGATNLLTGVAEAQLDNFPLVAITAQQQMNPHQHIDTVSLFAPVTKLSFRLDRDTDMSEKLIDGFRVARNNPQGAVHIEISDEFSRKSVSNQASYADSGGNVVSKMTKQGQLDTAIDLIHSSQKGIIIAGDHVAKDSLLQKEVYSFARHFSMPVVTSFMGKGSISDKDSLSLLSIGMGAPELLYEIFSLADIIITIGYDPVEGVTRFCNPNAEIIEIHSYKTKTVPICKPSVQLIGDVKQSLADIRKKKKKLFHFPEADKYRIAIENKVLNYNNFSYPFHPLGLLLALSNAVPKNTILLTDVGAHKMWFGAYYPVQQKETIVIPNGFASMGFGLPGAIGAKIARPKNTVVAVCGDGGFLMNIQELETAVRLELDLLIVVIVDETFSLIKSKFRHEGYDTDFTMHFNNPDFSKLVSSFGATHLHASRTTQLDDMMRKALALSGVRVVTVPFEEGVYDQLFAQRF